MQSRELVELAALLACHGPSLLLGSGRLSTAAMDRYWTASKCRLDRWSRALKLLRQLDSPRALADGRSCRQLLRGTLEEILTGDALTRVFTALVAAADGRRLVREAEPIARSVFLGHQEARNRALQLLFSGAAVDPHDGVALNQLRRSTEHWSDLLIGQLSVHDDVSDLAVDPQRARQFAADLRERHELGEHEGRWSLWLSSLKASLAAADDAPSPNADLNAEIAAAVLESLPPEMFDSVGWARSVWMTRLSLVAQDTAGLIEELFAEMPSGGGSGVTLRRRLE